MASSYILYAILLAIIAHLTQRIYKNPLKSFSGPFLARWTDLWRVADAINTKHDNPSVIRLHQKYGDIVRIAPNALSFADPRALRDIYGTNKHFAKSKFYSVAAAVAGGRVTPSLFSSTDAAWHDQLRRAVQPAFNLSSLVQYEPFVSSTITTYIEQLERRFADRDGEKGVIDLPCWMHWYSFDVIGEITYGSRFGFLEQARDIDEIIGRTDNFLSYFNIVAQAPWLDQLFLKNPLLLWLKRRGLFNGRPNPAVPWALERQNARIEAIEQGEHIAAPDGRTDLLDKFLQARKKHADTMTNNEVLAMGLSLVFAGSETTAITLTAIFHFLLKHPLVYKKLQEELDENFSGVDGPVAFDAAHKLTYLDACIKETFRLHPAGRFSPERVVPPSGAMIAGQEIPPYTVVSMNPWVLHRREEIFGADTEEYRPERWLSATTSNGTEADSAQHAISEMNRHLFQFGADRFNCIGKNIALLEIYKLVPSLLMAFEFELDEPEKDWRFEQGSFVNVSGVDVRIRRRK